MKDLGEAATGLAQFEKEPLKQCLGIVAARGLQVCSQFDTALVEAEAAVEAPLKEAVRALREVKATMEDRSRALSALSQAQADVDAKRSRLTKLRGTPGVRQDRLAMAERDLSVAMQHVEVQRADYNTIVARMGAELQR